MPRSLLIIIAAIIFVTGMVLAYRNRTADFFTVRLGGETFMAEVAATPDARSRGLSGRASLPDHGAMIFTFPLAARYSFWMKDMQFPIDIIWLRALDQTRKRATVVHVVSRALPPRPGTPDAELATYAPAEDADLVLELPAGSIERLHLAIGSPVEIY